MSAPSSLFRSEQMSLVQLYVPLEIAPQTIAELGELGEIQFNDLNAKTNAFQRTFVNEIKRLNEIERRLRFLTTQTEKSEIEIPTYEPTASYAQTRSQADIDQLDTTLLELEARITQMNTSKDSLTKRFLELTELRHVLRETANFFQQAESRAEEIAGIATHENDSLLGNQERRSMETGAMPTINIGFVAGVIPRPKMAIFERILFRSLRGNLYMNHAEIAEPIVDPASDESVYKNVFIVFAHGKELINKIRKICESMGATIYPVDEQGDKRRENALEVMSRIEDLRHVLDNTKAARHAELRRVSVNLDKWANMVKKEKAIHHTMNLLNYDLNRKALIGEGWCPTNSVSAVQYALRAVTERTGSTIAPLLNELPTRKEPPTYHRTNKFTSAFQEIVDAYGIATYGEVNPGLFTTITFPFLFAVMFGDFGHGILVTVCGLFLVLNEKKFNKTVGKDDMWDMFYGGRYIILLMGIFSMYTGLVYNDIFSMSMTLFESRYDFKYHNATGRWVGEKTSTYGFGIDPAWHGAENNLIFTNSYKMKMSILMGMVHMSFGVCLQIYNHLHFKRPINIWAEFVPQILYLWSIFGYLCFLIVFKWFNHYPDPSKAPGLLNTLIYMVLSPGSIQMQLYPGQGGVQVFLLLVAFIAIPWMLLAKPYILYQEHLKTVGAGYAPTNTQGEQEHNEEVDEHGHGHEFDFSEIFIHQMIHTIEFTLNGVSNTASYLRLWALSLAHAQLSEVCWTMVMKPCLNSGNAFSIVFGFYIWFQMTVGILIGMEGLSAFLHALRLHWVEFQNKFYGGQGRKFIPFSFKNTQSEE
ncbi:V-type ATPase, V0 complex, 116kDa subunit family [Gorgonomyces haynaldii]|nr:V-type ATPase, V0 complex, 116kDa subunit family [Gorgonomyces haynaldii]